MLVFEDMQWADPALVDFIDYLLEWSRGYPLFVLALGRPAAAGKGFSGGRNQTQLHLEPLGAEHMRTVVEQMVPGLAEEVVRTIVERSEGVPLYAVETVRMLLDKGLLQQEGAAYRTAGPLPVLEVPESLHGLIAARLDGLTPDERRAVHDVAVLGKTFTLDAAADITQRPREGVERLLGELVRKDILSVQADPRSPERGQYGFVQDLVREVAYETLGRQDRRERHLRVAAYLERSAQSEGEMAEVLASHYAEAFRASQDAPDAPEIRAKAREMFARAGDRSASLGAPEQAQGYFEQAIALTDDELEQAALHKRAGEMATSRGLMDDALAHLQPALETYERAGLARDAALVSVSIAQAGFLNARFNESIESLRQAVATLEQEEPGPELAAALAQLGRLLFFTGSVQPAIETLERALTLAERFTLADTFSNALNSKALAYMSLQRPQEAETLLRKALEVAEAAGLDNATMRALNNLQTCLSQMERLDEDYEINVRAVAHARRTGDRVALVAQVAGPIGNLFLAGRWDEAVALHRQTEELLEGTPAVQWGRSNVLVIAQLYADRGENDQAQALLERFADSATSESAEERVGYLFVRAAVNNVLGRYQEALQDATQCLGLVDTGMNVGWVKVYAPIHVIAALGAGDLSTARAGLQRLAGLPPGLLTPFARGVRDSLEARLRAAEGSTDGVADLFESAAETLRAGGLPFALATSQLAHAEWLAAQDRGEEARAPLEEARAIFERLRARPWLERADRVRVPEVRASVAT